jgi:hypothetical protein
MGRRPTFELILAGVMVLLIVGFVVFYGWVLRQIDTVGVGETAAAAATTETATTSGATSGGTTAPSPGESSTAPTPPPAGGGARASAGAGGGGAEDFTSGTLGGRGLGARSAGGD